MKSLSHLPTDSQNCQCVSVSGLPHPYHDVITYIFPIFPTFWGLYYKCDNRLLTSRWLPSLLVHLYFYITFSHRKLKKYKFTIKLFQSFFLTCLDIKLFNLNHLIIILCAFWMFKAQSDIFTKTDSQYTFNSLIWTCFILCTHSKKRTDINKPMLYLSSLLSAWLLSYSCYLRRALPIHLDISTYHSCLVRPNQTMYITNTTE